MRWRGLDPFASSSTSITTDTQQPGNDTQPQSSILQMAELGGHGSNQSLDSIDEKESSRFKSKLGLPEQMEHLFDSDALLAASDASCSCSSSSSAQLSFPTLTRHSQLSITQSSASRGPLLPTHPDDDPDPPFNHPASSQDNNNNDITKNISSSSNTEPNIISSLMVDQDDDDDPGQDHACPENSNSALTGAPIWKLQNTPSTCEFTHTILNYSQKRESGCKKAEYSATTVDNLGNRWRLIVYVNGNGRASNHHLSLFLQVADAEELTFGWKKNVSYVLTLEHPNGPTLGFTKRNPDKTFKLCPKAIDWGWSQFITSDRIQQEGFITNDSLTVRAYVTVKTSSIIIEADDAELYLKCAVEEGKVHAVETCLAQGASVNCQFKDDLYTPLHTACSASASEVSLDVLNLLLQKGANCNACNKWRETPLLIAANNGHTKAVAALLGKGADSTLCSEAGWSALTFAAHKGYDEIVSLLIAANAPVNCRVTEDLSTPLHKACAGNKPGHLNCVQLLLSAGADVHALNKWKETPLLTAANHGQAGTVGALLNAGADPCKCTDTGWSPLSIASYKGHDEVVVLLLEKGAPTEEEDTTLSALLQAATKGLPTTVEILLQHGADHSVTTKKGDTALSILVEQNLIDVATLMVSDYKASVPRCSRDRKKVQRARLLINLRMKQQQQRECSLSLDSDDYSDQDELDDGSNEALHDSGGSQKKKGIGRLSVEKSIENAEAEAKAAAEALLLEIEQEDAQAQKEELLASNKKNKKKKKRMKDRLLKLEEERMKKELLEEEERNRLRRLQEDREREQREKDKRLEAERIAVDNKKKEDMEKRTKKESAKAYRMERKAFVENGKLNSPREKSPNIADKKNTATHSKVSPLSEHISSPDSKHRSAIVDRPVQLLLPKSPTHSQTSLLPRNNKKVPGDQCGHVTTSESTESFIDRTSFIVSQNDSSETIESSTIGRFVGGIEHPSVSLFRREKVSELLNSFSKIQLPISSKLNPLSLFESYTIRSIWNKWIIRASQSLFMSMDPLIPSWQDVDLLETFFQRQFISESQRSYSKPTPIRMDAAKEAGSALMRACSSLASEVDEYAKKIEQQYSGNWSDTAFNMSFKDTSLNGSDTNFVVIDWSGRSQVYLPIVSFNRLRSRFCGPSQLFLSCVFNLVTRYSTRRDVIAGTSYEYRLPRSTLEVLQRELNITLELSCEPLFVHNDNRFFGLFNDVDCLFGGLPAFGADRDDHNMNKVWKNGGSAAILTGCDSHTTALHLRKMLDILEHGENNCIPISFALFFVMEGLREIDGTPSALEEFNVVRSWFTNKQLKFIRCFELLPGGYHSYAVGDADGKVDTPSQNSVFLLLQNDYGYERFYFRNETCQNLLATLLAPKAIPTKASIFDASISTDRALVVTPLSLTPVPSSPTSNFVQGFVMDVSMSDPVGLSKCLDPGNLKTAVTPVPTLSATGSRRRERLFQLVDDGDDAEDFSSHSDVMSGMLRNLQNSSRFLLEHESSDHDVDIEAISLMGILPSTPLGFLVDDTRNKVHDNRHRIGSTLLNKNHMDLRSSF